MRRLRVIPMSLAILGVSLGLAFLFNLVMPQGVGILPQEIAAPLWKPVDLAGAKKLYQEGALMVDAREPGDYKLSRVRGAVNLPPQELSNLWPLLKETILAAPRVVVYGRGYSSYPGATIGQFLKKQGVKEVWVLNETFFDLKQAGFPLRERRKRRAQ